MDDRDALEPRPAILTSTAPGPSVTRNPFEPTSLEETLEELAEMARGKCGRIPPETFARHVVRVTEGGDWPLRRGAMEAVLRRCRFGERDGLAVLRAPARSPFGLYATGRTESRRARRVAREARPYTTELLGLDAIQGSCDCPDFLLGSLGLCKHLLCVLNALPRRSWTSSAPPPPRAAPWSLAWDPVRPLLGKGDRLLGLRWTEATHATAPPIAVRRARASFRASTDPGDAHVFRPVASRLTDARKRVRFLEELLAAHREGRRSFHVTPAARALLRDELARESGRVEAAGRVPALVRALATLKRKLYLYQVEGVRRFFEEERLLLADDMGLGKTTEAVAACHALYTTGQVKRGLLIVPASLKPQWVREWQATSDVPVRAVDGSKAERARLYRDRRPGFSIIGYEQLLRDLPEVQALGPELVVLDEAQRIKNWATKSHAYVRSLSPRYRLVLSGTPFENRLEELASVLEWIDPVALSPKWRLTPWHTYAEGDGAEGRAGAKNLATLRERLRPVLVRRVRSEVLSQLPARTDTRVSVPMTEEQRVEHDDLNRPIAQLLSIGRRRPLLQSEFLRLMTLLNQQRMISNGLGQVRFEALWPVYEKARPEPSLLEGLFAPKLSELRRIVEAVAVDQGRKMVIFSQWRRMLRLAAWAIGDVLGRAGVCCAFFTGAESPRIRTQNLVDFHDEPRARVLFLSDAGGVGLNLQKAASCCVNLELPWNPAVLEQRIGRIYRLGQKRPIDVYNLVCDYGIESRIASLVSSKKALFSGLFDGSSDEVRFESGRSSFLADVEKLAPEVPGAHAAAEAGAEEEVVELEGSELAALESQGEATRAEGPKESPAESDPNPNGEGPANGDGRHDIAGLFSLLRAERTPEGGLRLEAPPEAAASLAALFEGMGRLLRQASPA